MDNIHKKDIYVLVCERDGPDDNEFTKNRPIVMEEYADHENPLEAVCERQVRIGDRFGKTRIAKLVFIDE